MAEGVFLPRYLPAVVLHLTTSQIRNFRTLAIFEYLPYPSDRQLQQISTSPSRRFGDLFEIEDFWTRHKIDITNGLVSAHIAFEQVYDGPINMAVPGGGSRYTLPPADIEDNYTFLKKIIIRAATKTSDKAGLRESDLRNLIQSVAAGRLYPSEFQFLPPPRVQKEDGM